MTFAARSGRLVEEPDRRGDRGLVVRRQRGNPGPRLSRVGRVLASGLVELRELLLEGNSVLEISFDLGLLLEQCRQIVPLLRPLEQPAQLLARLGLAGLDGGDLLPGLDGGVPVPQLRLAETGRFPEVAHPAVLRGPGSAGRLEEDVAKLGVLPRLPEVRLQERECVGVRRICVEHVRVDARGLVAAVLRGELLRLVDQSPNVRRIEPWRGLRLHLGRRVGLRHRSDGRLSPGSRGGLGPFGSFGLGRFRRGRCPGLRVARGAASLLGHHPRGVRFDVGRREGTDLGLLAELIAVIDRELDGPIVAREHLESAGRVSEAMLARIELGQVREQIGGFRLGVLVDALVATDTLEDEGAELLHQDRVLRVHSPRLAQRVDGAVQVPDGAAHLRLVLIEGQLALGIRDERLLHREVRHGFGKLSGRLEDLPDRVDRVGVLRIVLDGPAVVLGGLGWIRERRVLPDPAELLMEGSHVHAHLGILLGQGPERLGTPLEQRRQRLGVPLLAV
jgi:hypothetical protein